jgi:hypothetical protein
MLCNQCDAMIIQGLLCHEWGCPGNHTEKEEENDGDI